MSKYLILFLFLAGCAPKGFDACGTHISTYGKRTRQYVLPATYYVSDSVPDNYYEVIKEAAADINSHLSKPVIIITRGNKFIDRDYIFSIHFAYDWYESNNIQAYTGYYDTNEGALYDADIVVNMERYNFMSDGFDFKTLMRHELMHSLGFAHNEESTSVMQPYLPSNTIRDLSDKDIENLQCVYETAD